MTDLERTITFLRAEISVKGALRGFEHHPGIEFVGQLPQTVSVDRPTGPAEDQPTTIPPAVESLAGELLQKVSMMFVLNLS